MTRTRIALVAVLIVVLSGAAAYWFTRDKPAGKSAPISIAGGKNISFLPLIAQEKGLFFDPHHEPVVTYSSVNTGKLAIDAVLSGNADLGVVLDANIAQLSFEADPKLVIVAGIMHKTDDGIAARSDRGIRTPADLAGKSIAYIPGSSSEAFLWRLMEKNNVEFDPSKLISSSPAAIGPALTGDGGAAAIAIWQPWRRNALTTLKDNGVEFRSDGIYRAEVFFVMRRDRVPQIRDSVKNLLATMIKTEKIIADDPQGSQAILAKQMGMDLPTLQATWSDYQSVVSLRREIVDNLVAEAGHLKRTQPAMKDKPIPNYKALVDASLLMELDPSRVDESVR